MPRRAAGRPPRRTDWDVLDDLAALVAAPAPAPAAPSRPALKRGPKPGRRRQRDCLVVAAVMGFVAEGETVVKAIETVARIYPVSAGTVRRIYYARLREMRLSE